MKPHNPYRKRQQIFADRAIQSSLAWRLAGHWVLFTAVLLVLNTFLQMSMVFPQRSFGESFVIAAWSQIPLLVCIAVLVPLFTRDALRISNRLAGPMVRLRKSLQSLAAGEKVPPLVFRENDYWLESATEFNRVRQLVLGLYKDLDIPDGPQGSEQLAVAANLLHGNIQANQEATASTDSQSNALQSSATQPGELKPATAADQETPSGDASATPSSLSLANRVIWQGERYHKPSRYVNHEPEAVAPTTEVTEPTEIPVNVSLR
ncbi:MAG: hypothetical protein J0M26_09885 [Planctomycetes bacterium]|nr:hypothetical protein [Planctomycetota bacterium]